MRSMLRVTSYFLIALSVLACVSTNPNKPVGRENKRKVAELNTQIAIEHLRAQDYKLALTKLDKATAADSGYAPAHNTLGILHNRLGQQDKADRSFRRALQLAPDDPLTLNNYGQFLCQSGEHEKGQQMFAKASANPLYRTPEISLTNAGTCALTQGNAEKAEEYFRQGLDRNPRVAAALLNMAFITFDSQRFLPARAYIQRFSEIAKHSARSLWLGIQIERELDDKDAEASYKLQLDKNFPDSRESKLAADSA